MIRQLLPFALSVLTLLGMWLAGNKDWRAWLVGLLNQGLWITFAIWFQAWGLLPLTVALVVVYSRNLRKWRRTTRTDDLYRNGYQYADENFVRLEDLPPGVEAFTRRGVTYRRVGPDLWEHSKDRRR